MIPPQAKQVAAGLRAHGADDAVETWWLCNEARRNAVTPQALRWMAQRCTELHGGLVVLRGAGDRAFCAGFDLTALAQMLGRDPATPPDLDLIAATTAIRQANATFVAALDGHAVGAGVELACACDLRLARRGMVFAVPAAELGVVYHAEGLACMREVFGPAGVRRLLLLGDRIEAEDAWSAGALVRLYDPGQLEPTLADVVDRLQRAAPLSLQGNRDLLRTLDREPLGDEVRAAHEARREAAYGSEDMKEARRAREERRPPQFRGR